MKSTSPVKYQHVRANLEAAIRSGEFAVGEQLPSEQSLADRYGVSYLTARRAVCELVEADLLERRGFKGTFVRAFETQTTCTTLNLITSSYDHAQAREFISLGSQFCEREKWLPNVVRLSSGQQDAAVRAIRSGDPTLLLLDEIPPRGALALAIRSAKGKAVCIGSLTAETGGPCVLNEPEELIHSGVSYLIGLGHRDLIMVSQVADIGWTQIQNESWCKATATLFSPEEAKARMVAVRTALYQRPTHDTYDAVRKFLTDKAHPVSAFVSIGEEITQGVMAAIRHSGLRVPEDVSVLNVMDSPAMHFAHPSISSVDINMEAQFEIALDIVKSAQKGEEPPAIDHFVATRIMERDSTRPI